MSKKVLFDDSSSNEESSVNENNRINISEVEVENINTVKKQNSIITIFSIWNTMVGTSLLTMPWAMQISGFALGGISLAIMGVITFYTVSIILSFPAKFKKLHPEITMDGNVEYAYIIKHYLGKPGFIIANFFSFLAFVGALVVFFVLITDFTYDLVAFVHDRVLGISSAVIPLTFFNKTWNDMICQPNVKNESTTINIMPFQPSPLLKSSLSNSVQLENVSSIYEMIWDRNYTVPFLMLIMLLLITYCGSTTFLSRFNAFGIVSQIYLITFVIIKCSTWGLINFDIKSNDHLRKIQTFRPGFYKLTGISLLAFFIHNAIPFIMKAQKKPKHNVRDAGIAFFFVTLTYMIFGLGIFIFFPLPKQCLFDNLLDNFSNSDILCSTCRIALFIHLITVYPLALNILLRQFFLYFMDIPNPNRLMQFAFILFITTFACIFAVFYPDIGAIISFVGALSGFVYSLTVPCLCRILFDREVQSLTEEELFLKENPEEFSESEDSFQVEDEDKIEDVHVVLTKRSKPIYYMTNGFHVSLMVLGLVNFLVQFYPLPVDT